MKPKKITSLTKEQEASFPEFVDKWTKIGFCTEPANRSEAERGIINAYKSAKLQPPKSIVWCESPLSMMITKSLLKSVKETLVGDSVWDPVWNSVRNSVWDSVWNSVGDSVRASVWASVGDSVEASVRDSVRYSVEASVRDSVRYSVVGSVRASVWASVGDSVYGQHDAGWLSFYDYFGEACGLREIVNPLDGIMTVARNAGWWLPCENICFVSERHNVCRVDDRGRIHCENGPAIEYPDGFAIYGWHGTRVPENWIKEKDKLKPEEVLKCENVEQRAAGLAIIGMRKFLDHLPHKIVDSSVNPQIGDLIEITLPGLPESELYLKFLCPRNGEMIEPVNKRELEKADLHHAHAWHSRIPARLFSFAQQRS